MEQLYQGVLSLEEAKRLMKVLPYENLEFARIDHRHRLRKGFPEVIYSPGKTRQQVRDIAIRLAAEPRTFLVTRVNTDIFQDVKQHIPGVLYHADSHPLYLPNPNQSSDIGLVCVVWQSSRYPYYRGSSHYR